MKRPTLNRSTGSERPQVARRDHKLQVSAHTASRHDDRIREPREAQNPKPRELA